jgi:hypothetical protein
MNLKYQALSLPGLGFVVGLRIYNFSPWERKRRMGTMAHEIGEPPGSADDGGARDWEARDGGEE